VYRVLRDSGGTVDPEAVAGVLADDHDPRVLVGMLEQAGIVRRGYDAGRTMRVELLPVEDGAGAVVDGLLDRLAREAAARVERIVSFADSTRCRHLQVAEHFDETLATPCGACDVCAPRAAAPQPAAAAPPLPADPAEAIVDAVRGLTWPLGRRSLVALLRGSVKAPPSARRSAAFGALAAASDAQVTRWVRALEVAGALDEVETDGFRVLKASSAAQLPSLAPPALAASDPLVAELRAWRTSRAREDGVPAYVVLHDATLDELAARRPRSTGELAAIRGFGPTKLERYGDELLALLEA
jgi:ATP-dependent DNA helicase RecQ